MQVFYIQKLFIMSEVENYKYFGFLALLYPKQVNMVWEFY